jgi:hypothetical protein
VRRGDVGGRVSWVRLDDGYPEHPKVADLSDAAFRADVEGTCFSSRSRRDGHIPAGVALRMWGKGPITELVAAGKWHEGRGCGTETCILGTGDGYVVHDFLDYNDPEFVRDARRNAASNAARIRWSIEEENRAQTDARSNATANAESPDSAMRTYIGVGGSGSKNMESPEFVEFYDKVYPRKQGRGAARKAWASAIRKANPQDILAAAHRFADDPNREPAFTPHPSTWLNQERWSDDPLPPRGGHRAKGSVQNLLAFADRMENR